MTRTSRLLTRSSGTSVSFRRNTKKSNLAFSNSTTRNLSQIVTTKGSLNEDTFKAQYFGMKPLVIRQGFEHLRANTWGDNNFQALCEYGSRIVPIEVSRQSASYSSSGDRNQNFEAAEVPMSLFLHYLAEYKNNGSDKSSPRLYLAQCALFDIVPELYEHVCQANFVHNAAADRQVPNYTMVGRGDIYNINAWIGVDTHTPVRLFELRRTTLSGLVTL